MLQKYWIQIVQDLLIEKLTLHIRHRSSPSLPEASLFARYLLAVFPCAKGYTFLNLFIAIFTGFLERSSWRGSAGRQKLSGSGASFYKITAFWATDTDKKLLW